jgi:hypothetical protein
MLSSRITYLQTRTLATLMEDSIASTRINEREFTGDAMVPLSLRPILGPTCGSDSHQEVLEISMPICAGR